LFVAFKTPEEFFLDEAPTTKYEWGSLNPREYIDKLTKGKASSTSPQTYHKNVIFLKRIKQNFHFDYFLDSRSCYFTRTTSIRFDLINI
jgi:hypothetical protein